MGDEAGAGDVGGVEELAEGLGAVGLACVEVLTVFGCEEGALMVIEPPGEPGGGGVLEVDDGVLVAGEVALKEEAVGFVDEALVGEVVDGADALAVEAGEDGGGACAVEAVVVVEDAAVQNGFPFVPLRIR